MGLFPHWPRYAALNGGAAAANAGALGASGRVDSVRQAILLLRISRVRDITLATAIIDRFKAVPPFNALGLWPPLAPALLRGRLQVSPVLPL